MEHEEKKKRANPYKRKERKSYGQMKEDGLCKVRLQRCREFRKSNAASARSNRAIVEIGRKKREMRNEKWED